jgi:hypothetical protein
MGEGEQDKPWRRRPQQAGMGVLLPPLLCSRSARTTPRPDAAKSCGRRRPRLQEEASAQQQPAPPPAPDGGLPLDLQQQLVAWYRNTCLVAGAALAGSVCHWNFGAPGRVRSGWDGCGRTHRAEPRARLGRPLE